MAGNCSEHEHAVRLVGDRRHRSYSNRLLRLSESQIGHAEFDQALVISFALSTVVSALRVYPGMGRPGRRACETLQRTRQRTLTGWPDMLCNMPKV